MFVRIGMLAWWLGAIVLALVLAGTGYNYYEHMNCPWTMAAHDKNTKAREAVEAAYAQAHPTSKGLVAAFDAARAIPDSVQDSPALAHEVESCSRYSSPLGALTFFGIVVLALWSLAFVCGGSFWKPPVART